ncbi:hypothetical protein IC611_07150 [Proteus mirabilis]
MYNLWSGELSAINGVAGAFAEQVPIIHIVGAPSQSKQEKGKTLHHCLATGRFDAFEKCIVIFQKRRLY